MAIMGLLDIKYINLFSFVCVMYFVFCFYHAINIFHLNSLSPQFTRNFEYKIDHISQTKIVEVSKLVIISFQNMVELPGIYASIIRNIGDVEQF